MCLFFVIKVILNWGLLHLLENTFHRKRISANPTAVQIISSELRKSILVKFEFLHQNALKLHFIISQNFEAKFSLLNKIEPRKSMPIQNKKIKKKTSKHT